MSTGSVLVTGAAGFIGSHTVLELLTAGYKVTALDNFVNAIPDESNNAVSLQRVTQITGLPIDFKKCDLLEEEELEELFKNNKFSSVIHLAALKAVGESVEMPLEYYENNIVGSLNLITCCQKYGVKDFVFSSSATVYGVPEELPIKETAETGQGITNPYGRTKYFVEQILIDVTVPEKDWNISILRYFNPCGAHPSGLIGEDPQGIPNNLMPFVAQVAAGKLPELKIYGTKFDTPDGTGVRDYIHIVDLAKAHVAALKRIEKLKSSGEEHPSVEIYNIGTGKGYSVKQMVAAFEKASGRTLKTIDGEPRTGDLPEIYCDATLAEQNLGWKAEFGIDQMCESMWNWITKNPNGFKK